MVFIEAMAPGFIGLEFTRPEFISPEFIGERPG